MESRIFARLGFDPGVLVILSMILTIILIALVLWLIMRQSRLELNYKLFMRGKGARSLEESIKQHIESIDIVREQTDVLHKRLTYVEKSMSRSYQKCAVVRYDAFKELGGKLSFALTILDDNNTGFVMNCIHSREGSFSYIKDIIRGECEMELSEEEFESVNMAINSSSPQPKTSVSDRKSLLKRRKNNPSAIVSDITEKSKDAVPSKKETAENVSSDTAEK